MTKKLQIDSELFHCEDKACKKTNMQNILLRQFLAQLSVRTSRHGCREHVVLAPTMCVCVQRRGCATFVFGIIAIRGRKTRVFVAISGGVRYNDESPIYRANAVPRNFIVAKSAILLFKASLYRATHCTLVAAVSLTSILTGRSCFLGVAYLATILEKGFQNIVDLADLSQQREPFYRLSGRRVSRRLGSVALWSVF